MDILKTLLFTVLVPGTVAGLIPAWIRGGWALRGPAWAVAAGGATLAAGIAIYLWCAWDFATAGRGTPSPTHPPRALVVRGLYRHSRNPMYVGVVLAVLGQAVWARSPGLFGYAAFLAAAFHLRVVVFEEPYLRRTFGAAYGGYVAAVPRWFGRGARRDEAPRIGL
ncbi:MAG TPA: isoprenylcysteine carboxylmethyltransferase family protein [Longimicrobium sp.]|nr:isoprenylcysteine carboxylmethyltransferase family protein [Longimicrobium sp.]